MDGVSTRWSEATDVGCPLNDYPRPQLQRDSWQCLNGEYDYAILPLPVEKPSAFQGKIIVPFAVESELSGVKADVGENYALWYRRFFTVDEAVSSAGRVILHFGAVDWQCSIWINGSHVGGHTGGYCPFSFDITGCLWEGENELLVRVTDPTDTGLQPRGKQVKKPFGFWYTSTTGIWQTVWLEGLPENALTELRITPDLDRSGVKLSVNHPAGCSVTAEIIENGTTLSETVFDKFVFLPVPEPRLWSPETPFLYDLKLTLTKNGEVCDCVNSYFAMRKFSLSVDKNGYTRLCLNNKPYFMRGVLDQGYWPESGLTPPCDEAMIFDIEKMRELGYNMLRKHIKVEPARWYYHCDRLGMLVWQDMPNGALTNLAVCGILPNVGVRALSDRHYSLYNRNDEHGKRLFKAELDEMLHTLYNVPSICCWVPFNESWGQFDANEIAEHVKLLDPTRFVDHASGWQDQGGGDMKSIHRYIVPLRAYKKDNRAFVISEYGGYSLALAGHTWSEKRVGYLWFKSRSSLSKAYEALQKKQALPLINKGLCALVYTQLSDVENELNGIYTYDRKELKIDPSVIIETNKLLRYQEEQHD